MMTLREFEEQQLAAFDAGASGVLAWDTSLVYHQYLYRKINIIRRFTPFASD
jgi:hypothetical protein